MTFADFLDNRISQTGSILCAGLDPRIESLPKYFLKKADSASKNTEDFVEIALSSFYQFVIESASNEIACAKPNIAFFEQYGIGGLKAFKNICATLNEHNIPIIADVKRGDIGSTAAAYSNAFLAKASFQGKETNLVNADAITVNPFLGFDTVEVFLKSAAENGKGIFVLVKTSNPGSSDIQNLKTAEQNISEILASWLNQNVSELMGDCGYSGLGAVVGATYPEEAKKLRELMPKNLFLIPGYGAQGGSSQEALVTFDQNRKGGVVNASRGLIKPILESKESLEIMQEILTSHIQAIRKELS